MIRDGASLAFWLKSRLKRAEALRLYRELRAHERWTPDALARLNWEKRCAIVAHAFATSPFYREKLKAVGFEPGDLKTETDFERLPVMTKDELRANTDRILMEGVDRAWLFESTTGGSTGEPLRVYHDKRYLYEALGWRMMAWWGVAPGMNEAVIWRTRVDLNPTTWYGRHIQGWPTRRCWLNAASMTDDDVALFVKRCRSIKPRILQGYIGAVSHVAHWLDEQAVSMPPPRAVWVTSSPLSAVDRQFMERVYRAPVYDQYGCGEVYWLAAECRRRNGLHAFTDARHIEFVDADARAVAPGLEGDILLTDLENRAFPIIRYANGDRGAWRREPCPCGNALPLMAPVRGRMTDVIRLRDGTALDGSNLTTLFDDWPEAVRQFQVEFTREREILLRVVPRPDYTALDDVLDRVRANLERMVRGLAAVRIARVETIPHDGGKTRFVIDRSKEASPCA